MRGGGRRLVRGKTEVEGLIKGTDHERLDLLPADFSYRHMDLALDDTKKPTRRLAQVLAPIAGDYDYVFLDCPPSISLVSESVFEAADALLVPLIPATLSSRTYGQLRRVLSDDGPQVLAFFSMFDRRKRLHREVMDSLRAAHPSILDAVIPTAADIERMGAVRTVLLEFVPRGRAAAGVRGIVDGYKDAGGSGFEAGCCAWLTPTPRVSRERHRGRRSGLTLRSAWRRCWCSPSARCSGRWPGSPASLPHFNPDDDRDDDPVHPAVADLRRHIAEADAILICTPEYAGALPGSLKNLLEWTVGDGGTYRKPVAWINVSGPAAPSGGADAQRLAAQGPRLRASRYRRTGVYECAAHARRRCR